MARALWLLILVALAAQVIALVWGGHALYLWIQATEAGVASLTAFGLWIAYRRHDPRASLWPPLLPLALIAGAGAAKDICVASDVATPIWLVGILLGSVVWFLASTWRIWQAESRIHGYPDAPDKRT